MRLIGPIQALFPLPLDSRFYVENSEGLTTLYRSGYAYDYMKVVNKSDGMTYELQPGGEWKLFTAKGASGDPGKSIQFNWDGTKLGVRVEGAKDYTYVDLKGTKGDPGKSIEFRWNGTELGVRQEGQSSYTYSNLKGETGKALEFYWDGTKLGVRQQGQVDYVFSDLKGPKGDIGKSLQFNWDGTKLGVRVEGSEEYVYVDLKGSSVTTEEIARVVGETQFEDLNTEAKGLVGALNEVLGKIPEDLDLTTQEYELETEEKTIIGAINELKLAIDEIRETLNNLLPSE